MKHFHVNLCVKFYQRLYLNFMTCSNMTTKSNYWINNYSHMTCFVFITTVVYVSSFCYVHMLIYFWCLKQKLKSINVSFLKSRFNVCTRVYLTMTSVFFYFLPVLDLIVIVKKKKRLILNIF